MSSPQEILCAWGMHSHSKKLLFEAKDSKIKFVIPVCPHCGCPKRKHMKMMFSDGRVCIDKEIYTKLISVLKSSKLTLNGFPGGVHNLSEALKDLLGSLE